MNAAPFVHAFGFMWVLRREKDRISYVTNIGSIRNPRPRSLTRYAYEQAYGPLEPGWRVLAKDGNYLNWSLDNLRAEFGGEDYAEWHSRYRRSAAERDRFIAIAVGAGWDADDAWDYWRGGPSPRPWGCANDLI